MYLLGLMTWIAVSGGLAWLIAIMLSRRSSKWWLRPLLTILLMPVVFMAPLADEIIGKFQFDRLCEGAKEVKIYATHPVGEELYTPDGKWRGSSTNDDVFQLAEIKKQILRWDSGPSAAEVVPAAIPIRKYHTRIYAVDDGRLLAEWDSYGTHGGWVGRQLGGVVLVKSQCAPELINRSKLESSILVFKGTKGEVQ